MTVIRELTSLSKFYLNLDFMSDVWRLLCNTHGKKYWLEKQGQF